VLVALTDDASRHEAVEIATALRRRGIACEVAPTAAKFGKQIRYAERRGIPFVWFPAAGEHGEVKDIRSGEQAPADAASWTPPVEDLHPQIARTDTP
jgi:histidyl-tRNA synthetase